ncbi:hypothetical protein ASZ78_001593 [Callipepla squamata]|uniref:Lipase domain-containing protein n=1 Tax=Callipepla squamata TaxID=9009 RepID=A0A226NCF8_CALSU|nr:hypothetical protein ASZ78_001593 [Callipepla squamata]
MARKGAAQAAPSTHSVPGQGWQVEKAKGNVWVLTSGAVLVSDPRETCPAFTVLSFGSALIGTDLQVKLLLYTRQNEECAEELNSTASKYLDLTKKTTFIIHGYRPTGSAPIWIPKLACLLLSAEDMNIIVVDWNRGAATVIYRNASRNGRRVAEILKKFVDEMLMNGASLDSIHMIGVSLGAHISGFVGQMFDGQLGRITVGFFWFLPCHFTTHHSLPGYLPFAGLGYADALGHIDFYPNGGTDQPGCPPTVFAGLKYFKCDHQRSVYLFMASLQKSCNITTYPCESYRSYRKGKCTSCESFQPMPCPVLGYYAHEWKSHLTQQSHAVTSMYFDTADEEPFCLYHYFVDIVTWNKSTRRGTLSVVLVDSTGSRAESKVNHEAAAFQQYQHTSLLVGFKRDFENIQRISVTFSTGSAIGPKFKLRILRMRLQSLTNPGRPPLCRYDVVLTDEAELSFRPIPCAGGG